ncbi:hypothetical protein M3Y95_01033900 [Aphelenchoides besseyi]|nr:hypothetical protein M3Y95_01033900 [Aphelenchoides besseyi]
MRMFVLWSFFLTAIAVQEVYDLEYNNVVINLKVGTPAQNVYTRVSLTTDVIFIVSAHCGELNTLECPRYCYDPSLSKMYCRAECLEIDEIEWCNKPVYTHYLKYFDYFNSSTFELTDRFWMNTLENRLSQIGQWARETISFPPLDFTNSLPLELDKWKMINGMSVDPKLIYKVSAILGLAPGKSNFVHLLFEQNRIPNPVISITNDRMTIGDYNQQVCSHWRHWKAEGSNWILRFDSVQFYNQTMNTNVLVTFDMTTYNMFIPDELFDGLVESGIILGRSVEHYYIPCKTILELTLTRDGHQFLIPSSRLIRPLGYKICYTQIAPFRKWQNARHLYDDEPNWILNADLLNDFCIAFNYETNEIGIADSIDSLP